MNLFIGNLAKNVTADELRNAFSVYGEIKAVNILKDKLTKQSRGFGFVQMPNADEANKAITGLHGKTIIGQTISVFQAKTREDCKAYYKETHPEIIR